MSKYTTKVQDILLSYLDPSLYFTDIPFDTVIKQTADNFFNFPFDFYSSDADIVNKFKYDFLLRYYNNYIGFETVGMFKQQFAARLNLIMPHYLQLYDAWSQVNDPFTNVDVSYNDTENGTRNRNDEYTDTASTTNESTNNSQTIDSDNPQVTVSTNDYASTMSRGEMTNEASSSGSSSHEGQESEAIHKDSDRTEKGVRGKTRAELLKEYEKQIININRLIIDECRDLFLSIY